MTKERPQEIVPAKKSISSTNQISGCDVMKDNTSKVIKKMELQIPSYVQEYSDLYVEYLHMFDDIFGACYISEKQFFDKLGINQKTLTAFDDYSKTLTDFCSSQIDMSTNFLRAYVKMRISALKTYDSYMHTMLDSYANMLSTFSLTHIK